VPLENERIIGRYFEPELAAAMAKDQKAAARRNVVGLLDFDPFLDAQDWDVSAFDIAVSDAAAGTAKATVKFVNQGEAMTVVLDLVQARTTGAFTTSPGCTTARRKVFARLSCTEWILPQRRASGAIATTPALSGLRTRCHGTRWIRAPCRPRTDIKRGLKPNRAHGSDGMRRRIAAAAIDSDFLRPVRAKRRKTGEQFVVRFEFSVGDVVACSRVNGSGNMSGARFGGVADIGRPWSRIQQCGLRRESRRLFGADGRHTSRCQNDISGKRSARGDMI